MEISFNFSLLAFFIFATIWHSSSWTDFGFTVVQGTFLAIDVLEGFSLSVPNLSGIVDDSASKSESPSFPALTARSSRDRMVLLYSLVSIFRSSTIISCLHLFLVVYQIS